MSQKRHSQTSCFRVGLTGNIEVPFAKQIAQYPEKNGGFRRTSI